MPIITLVCLMISLSYPKSYAKAVKGIGSTAEKRENYYYICPKIWCPTSKVSMTQEQYDDKKDDVDEWVGRGRKGPTPK